MHLVVSREFKNDDQYEGDDVKDTENVAIRREILVIPLRNLVWVQLSLEFVVAVGAEESHTIPYHEEKWFEVLYLLLECLDVRWQVLEFSMLVSLILMDHLNNLFSAHLLVPV